MTQKFEQLTGALDVIISLMRKGESHLKYFSIYLSMEGQYRLSVPGYLVCRDLTQSLRDEMLLTFGQKKVFQTYYSTVPSYVTTR